MVYVGPSRFARGARTDMPSIDITLSDKFKSEYCRLWRSLFTLDTKSIEDIALKWGIQLPVDLFASAILLRPFQVDKRRRAAQNLLEEPPKSEYDQQVELKQRMRNMLANEALIPRVRLVSRLSSAADLSSFRS